MESGPARTTVPVASCPGMKGGVAITYIMIIVIIVIIIINISVVFIFINVSSKRPGPSRSMCRGQYRSHKWPPTAKTTIFKSTSIQLKGEPATIENNQKSQQKPSQANQRNHQKQGEKMKKIYINYILSFYFLVICHKT